MATGEPFEDLVRRARDRQAATAAALAKERAESERRAQEAQAANAQIQAQFALKAAKEAAERAGTLRDLSTLTVAIATSAEGSVVPCGRLVGQKPVRPSRPTSGLNGFSDGQRRRWAKRAMRAFRDAERAGTPVWRLDEFGSYFLTPSGRLVQATSLYPDGTEGLFNSRLHFEGAVFIVEQESTEFTLHDINVARGLLAEFVAAHNLSL